MKIIKTCVGIPFLWMKWGKKYRWISLEFSTPLWWNPRLEKYSYGFRTGWLFTAFGTGVVTKHQMDIMIASKTL